MISTENLEKHYEVGPEKVFALKGIDLSIKKGEFVSIMGPSGSGKTTLMNIIGCLDSPSKGDYFLNGKLVSDLSDDELAKIRNQEIGFIFQSFNLLARNSALSNVLLPTKYAGLDGKKSLSIAKEMLELVGLSDRTDHTPSELSGGNNRELQLRERL